MQQKEINVAILGFGLSGSTFHAPLISNVHGFKISHFMSGQQEKIKQLYPDSIVVPTLDEILANPQIQLVINTLPNEKHYAVTKECLLADKHVVVEKPFVIESKQGQELIQLAKKKTLTLSVYHNRRWDNGFLTLQKYRQELGKVYLYEAYFDRFRPTVNLQKWREQDKAGSGILYDLGSHLIDQALTLFGKPQALFADLLNQRENSSVTDYFHITLYYDKLRVILGSSSIITKPRPILAAYGDKGSYVKYGLDPQENALKNGKTPRDTGFGQEPSFSYGSLTIKQDSTIINSTIETEQGEYI